MLVLGSLLTAQVIFAQPLPVELVSNANSLWYAHTFQKFFGKQQRFGISHTTSGIIPVNGNQPAEWMSQHYVNWIIKQGIRLDIGSFYASKPGIQASLGVQFSRFRSNYGLLLKVRADPNGFRTRELFGFGEFKPRINTQIRLYSRWQFMYNATQQLHNRSYQYFRLGMHYRTSDFGLAYLHDVYGNSKQHFGQKGLYVRHVFN